MDVQLIKQSNFSDSTKEFWWSSNVSGLSIKFADIKMDDMEKWNVEN
jgi:hypothetical protein